MFTFDNSDTTNAEGFVYRGASGLWGTYDRGNGWQMSEISDREYFDHSILKIKITSDGKWHLYKNDVLFFEPPNAITLHNSTFALGSGDGTSTGAYNMSITAFKIYALDE